LNAVNGLSTATPACLKVASIVLFVAGPTFRGAAISNPEAVPNAAAMSHRLTVIPIPL
jgi:hypothetical protein